MTAGVSRALASAQDRRAMRATCRDARDRADSLRQEAVLSLEPLLWHRPSFQESLVFVTSIAAYHRKLGALRELHVWMQGMSVARRTPCSWWRHTAQRWAIPCQLLRHAGRRQAAALCACGAAAAARAAARGALALGAGRRCQHAAAAGALRELAPPQDPARPPRGRLGSRHYLEVQDEDMPGVVDALCRLPRLTTLSGPWRIDHVQLRRLSDALPRLTTLGLQELNLLEAPDACILSPHISMLASWHGPTEHWLEARPH